MFNFQIITKIIRETEDSWTCTPEKVILNGMHLIEKLSNDLLPTRIFESMWHKEKPGLKYKPSRSNVPWKYVERQAYTQNHYRNSSEVPSNAQIDEEMGLDDGDLYAPEDETYHQRFCRQYAECRNQLYGRAKIENIQQDYIKDMVIMIKTIFKCNIIKLIGEAPEISWQCLFFNYHARRFVDFYAEQELEQLVTFVESNTDSTNELLTMEVDENVDAENVQSDTTEVMDQDENDQTDENNENNKSKKTKVQIIVARGNQFIFIL